LKLVTNQQLENKYSPQHLKYLDQLCPNARGSSLGFSCSESILHTDNQSLYWLSWIWHFWCRLSITTAGRISTLEVH